MSASRRRYDALRAIVQGSPIYSGSQILRKVDLEIHEIGNCTSVTLQRRKFFLQVMHSTRALDSAINAVLLHNNINSSHSMGKMLRQLQNLPPGTRGWLPPATATRFVNKIATPRNKYAHQADAFPTSTNEVDSLVSEVHTCLTLILS